MSAQANRSRIPVPTSNLARRSSVTGSRPASRVGRSIGVGTPCPLPRSLSTSDARQVALKTILSPYRDVAFQRSIDVEGKVVSPGWSFEGTEAGGSITSKNIFDSETFALDALYSGEASINKLWKQEIKTKLDGDFKSSTRNMIINITGSSQSGKTALEFGLLEHIIDWLVSEMRIASSIMIKTLGKATPTSPTAKERTYDALQNLEIDMDKIDDHRLGTIDRKTLELLKSNTSTMGDRMQRLTKISVKSTLGCAGFDIILINDTHVRCETESNVKFRKWVTGNIGTGYKSTLRKIRQDEANDIQALELTKKKHVERIIAPYRSKTTEILNIVCLHPSSKKLNESKVYLRELSGQQQSKAVPTSIAQRMVPPTPLPQPIDFGEVMQQPLTKVPHDPIAQPATQPVDLDQKFKALENAYKGDIGGIKQQVEGIESGQTEQQAFSHELAGRTTVLEKEIEDLKVQLAQLVTSCSGSEELMALHQEEQFMSDTPATSSNEVISRAPLTSEYALDHEVAVADEEWTDARGHTHPFTPHPKKSSVLDEKSPKTPAASTSEVQTPAVSEALRHMTPSPHFSRGWSPASPETPLGNHETF